ncbi:polysaccharide pyruvyl transferase family protein [Bhargavaea massiliensis]|uniref:polysaccharide pyruvyl transferase family protein n=1 Tax=Bhargavaea massiliensis TaxID=2697500 RepID=UPI001BCE5FFD|nr:polysaccharide pyruvyl transferase family protein [Bhargavaea massiliensis]
MAKYFISCFSGAKNMGDEFILKCLVRKIKDYDKNAAITVTSLDPEYTVSAIGDNIEATEWRGIGLTKAALKNMNLLKAAIKNTDYVVIGGGGLLQDVHSVATIPRYLISAVFAKIYNKKVIYYSMGVGPIKNKVLISLVRDISNKFVDYISVRDEASQNYLKNIGVTTKIDVTSDPVFSISEYVPSNRDHCHRAESTKIGICFRQFKTTKETENQIEKLISELEKRNKQIYLFPLDYEEDKYLCNRLKSKFNNITIVDNYKTIEDLVSQMNKLDIMISMRLHGIITCASYGIPSIAVSYDPKVTNIQSKIGMEDFLIDINSFSSKVCLEKLNALEVSNEKEYIKFTNHVDIEKSEISSSVRNSVEYVDKNKKQVGRILCLSYFVRLFIPQVFNKLNKLAK